jgi:DNA-binding protein H-NS
MASMSWPGLERGKESMIEWLGVDMEKLTADERLNLLDEIYDGMSAQELVVAREMCEEKRKGKLEYTKQSVIEKMRSGLESAGINPDEIKVSFGKQRKSRSSLPTKYRSPDALNSWTGRGQVPVWLRDLEAQGHLRDEFLVTEKA